MHTHTHTHTNKLLNLLRSLIHNSFKIAGDQQTAYRPDIDGLRAFAVLAVVGYHYFPGWIKAGFIGVDIFFVISGFLIGGILLDNLKNNNFSIINFYQRRILRILPALIVVMVAVLVFGWFALLPDDYARLGKHILGGATFVSNFVLYFESGYWDTASHTKPLLHLWSLGVEEQFYLAFPIIIYLLWKVRNRLALSLILLFVVSFALNLLFFVSNPELDFYMPFTRFWELLAGVILAYFTKQGALDRLSIKWATAIGTVGLILLIASIWTINDKNFPGYKALMPVIGAVLFIAAGKESIVNRYLFSLKPIVFVGLISYPLYLWHWSLISCFRIALWTYFGAEPPMMFMIALVFASIVLAIITYYFIEKPIRFSKSRRGSKTIALVVLLAIAGAVGAGVYIKDGISDRWVVKETGGENWQTWQGSIAELKGPAQQTNKACVDRYNIDNALCMFLDTGGNYTTAIIGDSHAHSAYDSIAEHNAKIGINTVLLGKTGVANPITDSNKEGANERIIRVLQTDHSIRKVFIVFRNNNDMKTAGLKTAQFQSVIDKIVKDNREIFIVEENPELPYGIRTYLLLRSFIKRDKNIRYLTRSEILEQRKESRKMLAELKGATIIYTIDVFCPIDQCLLTDENGLPLYYDRDHLSLNAGGRFLVEKVLKPYLDE